MEKEQHPGQHRNASLGDRIDHWRNVSSSQGSNHCQHEPDPVYTSTSPMHGMSCRKRPMVLKRYPPAQVCLLVVKRTDGKGPALCLEAPGCVSSM
ncbi:uncharacterized protein M6G45_009669 isoform 3-T3 [Spheniscus humboldti]